MKIRNSEEERRDQIASESLARRQETRRLFVRSIVFGGMAIAFGQGKRLLATTPSQPPKGTPPEEELPPPTEQKGKKRPLPERTKQDPLTPEREKVLTEEVIRELVSAVFTDEMLKEPVPSKEALQAELDSVEKFAGEGVRITGNYLKAWEDRWQRQGDLLGNFLRTKHSVEELKTKILAINKDFSEMNGVLLDECARLCALEKRTLDRNEYAKEINGILCRLERANQQCACSCSGGRARRGRWLKIFFIFLIIALFITLIATTGGAGAAASVGFFFPRAPKLPAPKLNLEIEPDGKLKRLEREPRKGKRTLGKQVTAIVQDWFHRLLT